VVACDRARPRLDRRVTRLREIAPGLLLAALLAIGAQWLAGWIGTGLLGLSRSPVSGITLAILLGLLWSNLTPPSAAIQPGARFALTTVLRLGIVLLGLRLSVAEVGEIGLRSLPVIIAAIATALLLARLISRWLALPPRLGALIAVGTSICGATAIVATAPTIGAREEETSYAVACIALFGLLAMLFYPFVAFWLFDGQALRSGLFLGTAVHDTAQVLGAGMAYREYFGDAQTLDIATVTKMVRNLAMIAVIPIMALAFRPAPAAGATPARPPRWYELIPLFVVGFAALSLVRTLGDVGTQPFGLLSADAWRSLIGAGGRAADILLATAMAAVGLSTRFSALRSIGLRPLLAALLCALAVGGVAALTILALY
jgi:uncharacterized integral membrane protein (TIGR00698 family)